MNNICSIHFPNLSCRHQKNSECRPPDFGYMEIANQAILVITDCGQERCVMMGVMRIQHFAVQHAVDSAIRMCMVVMIVGVFHNHHCAKGE